MTPSPTTSILPSEPPLLMGVAHQVSVEAAMRARTAMENALLDSLAQRENPDLVMTAAYDGSFDAQMKLRGPYSGPRDQLWVHRAVERGRWDAVQAWFELGGVLTTEEHQPLTPLVWRGLCQCAAPDDPAPALDLLDLLDLLDVLRERMLNVSPSIYRKEILGTLRAWAHANDDPSQDSVMHQRLLLCRTWVDGLLDARPLLNLVLDPEDTRGLVDRSVAAIRALLTRAEQRQLHAIDAPDLPQRSTSRPRL